MGNYTLCIVKNNKAGRVILPGGEVRQFFKPIKAAEIMLECPNYFLVNANGLHIGRRFSALSADDNLVFGNLYILFPMRRLNSVVKAADMAVVLTEARVNATPKCFSGCRDIRISPVARAKVEVAAPPRGAIESVVSPDKLGVEGGESFPVGECKYKLSVRRSTKPKLATILEDSTLI